MHGRESRGIFWFLFCIFQRHTQQWRQFNIFFRFGGSWLGAHGRKWCIELRPRLLATYPTASDENITNEPAKTLCNEMWTASFQMLLWKPEVVILDIKTNDFIWVINEIINAQIFQSCLFLILCISSDLKLLLLKLWRVGASQTLELFTSSFCRCYETRLIQYHIYTFSGQNSFKLKIQLSGLLIFYHARARWS